MVDSPQSVPFKDVFSYFITLYFINYFIALHLFPYLVRVCCYVGVHSLGACVWRSKAYLWELFISFNRFILGMELQAPGLTKSSSTPELPHCPAKGSVFKSHLKFLFMCVCVWVYILVQVPVEAKAVSSPGARVWIVVSCCLTWLGIEPLFSVRAIHTLNLTAIFPAPTNDF